MQLLDTRRYQNLVMLFLARIFYLIGLKTNICSVALTLLLMVDQKRWCSLSTKAN